MLQRWKKNSKKGFTLVELIVVLVILAILAALLIPALTGYIDKAKEKQIIAETRQVVMAAQTLADEVYAQNSSTDVEIGTGDGKVDKAKVATLAEVDVNKIGDITFGEASDTTGMAGVVTKVVYTRDGKTCTYAKTNIKDAGTYTVTP